MTTQITLTNKNCGIEIDFISKEINGSDYTDQYNYPKCYNKTSRSIKKAAIALEQRWNDSMTMYQAMHILSENGIRMRSYCSMD